ncbi:MAG: cyclic nucleotide-binding domain-containing protein [Anaerolineaceae bacterium]
MNEVLKFKYLPIFRDLPAEELERIGELLETKNISAGETIFRQGDKADNLFILLTGKVSIRYKPYDGPPINISSIIPGWVFGWSAALGRETYTSEALALLPGSAFCLSKKHLLEICNLHDEAGIIFLDRLTSVIADRLNQTPKQILAVLAKMADQTEG